jgi:hypothetical protein
MSVASEYFNTAKESLLSVGEAVGVFAVGLGLGIVGVLRKKHISFKTMRFSELVKEQKFVQRHSQIHELLTELRVTVRASRCLVFQFHNGGSFADGTSIKRFSVTHESCIGGVTSMILESQDVLLTRYVDIIRVMDESASKIISVSSLPPSAFRSGLEINSVDYFSITPLRCLDGLTPLGFVCCHWCSEDQLDDIEAEGVSQENLERVISDSVHNINTHISYKVETK